MSNPIEITFVFFGKEYKARFWKNNYLNNNNTYIGILTWDEQYKYWEPWGDLTVNLDVQLEANKGFINVNYSGHEIVAALMEKGYVKDTGILRQSGFCVYPLVEFSEEFLNAIENVNEEGGF